MQKKIKSKILRFLIYLLIIYSLILTFYFIFQRSVVFKPLLQRMSPTITDLTKVEIVKLKTKDGLELNSWYYLPSKNQSTVILYLHGNSGNISTRESSMANYINAGFGVFLLEYRGYGDNPGYPTEEGLYHDARAAVEFLKSQGVKPKDLVVLGESMGTGITTQLATEYNFKGIVLQSPFTSMTDVGKGKYPYIPVDLLLRDRFESVKKIDKIHSPILFIHGDHDELIPISHMEKLYKKSKSIIKYKKIYKNYGHSDLPQYSNVVINFINNIKSGKNNSK